MHVVFCVAEEAPWQIKCMHIIVDIAAAGCIPHVPRLEFGVIGGGNEFSRQIGR